MLPNPHNESNLQTMPLFIVCFWPKNEAIWQKNGGPTETILHFFSRFSSFSGFFPLQPVVSEPLAPLQPLPKKSCRKHYRRFFVRSALCHNRRMTVEMTGRNEGCERWTAIKCPPALRAQRFGALSLRGLSGLCSMRSFAAKIQIPTRCHLGSNTTKCE